ncbi:MAG: R3H domain-containing nucleic acid-binding protein [Cyanobacteria bacterium P01_H01_bin.121]
MTQTADTQLQRGQEWLANLLQLCNWSTPIGTELKPSLTANIEGEPAQIGWLTLQESGLTAAQIECCLGDHGAVIDSIQYLANLTLNLQRDAAEQLPFMIELCEYRAKRQAELQSLADAAVAHVRETGQEYELQSLSSAERRQVHTLLKDYGDLATFSRGREPDRRLVVTVASAESEAEPE